VFTIWSWRCRIRPASYASSSFVAPSWLGRVGPSERHYVLVVGIQPQLSAAVEFRTVLLRLYLLVYVLLFERSFVP
jgi:hypothetical protein